MSLELFQKKSRESRDTPPEEVVEELLDDVANGEALVCAACEHEITTTAARIEMAGRHVHTCENPHGYVYVIGCFALAPGCVAVSRPESYFSWFPGYRWQIEHCRGCREQLGWLFTAPDHHFHGLILERLRERR